MAIHPAHLTIGTLFTNNFIFRVPKYQRYYAWDVDEIEDFLADLARCLEARAVGESRHHFFGGLVTVEAPVPGSARRNQEVIDGQQRLASFTTLVAQVKRYMDQLRAEMGAGAVAEPVAFLKERSRDLSERYLRYRDTVGLNVHIIDRLELSKPDRFFFKELLSGADPEPARESHRRLKNAFTRIGEYLDERVAEKATIVGKARTLNSVAEVLEQDWTVIHMSATDRQEAYMMFQVLNDRGMNLNDGELMRARILEVLDFPNFEESQEKIETDWNEILEDHPDYVDEFLRWRYASYVGKRPGNTSLVEDFLTEFFPAHAKAGLTDEDAASLVEASREVRDDVRLLAILARGEWPFPATPGLGAWHRERLRLLVTELQHTNCMPLLLAAARMDEVRFAAVVSSLERFVFRYKTIGRAHISPATNIYHSQAKEIRKTPAAYDVEDLRSALAQVTEQRVPDATFRQLLGELEYSSTRSNKPLKYFLMTLEHFWRWFEDGVAGTPTCQNLERVFDFAYTTIEHIYPQNADPKVDELEPLRHDLGNLTFLGEHDNGAAGNKPFAEKKEVLKDSSVLLNREIAAQEDWRATEVQDRKSALLDAATKIFVP